VILCCGACGRIWRYGGAKVGVQPGTSCPGCKRYVSFTRRVDQPLPDAGDYGGAEYLGVTALGVPVYFDRALGVVVEFVGSPDPFSRSREEPLQGSLEDFMREVAWKVGWRFHAEIASQ